MLQHSPRALEYFQQAREALIANNQSPAQALGLELVAMSRQGKISQMLELAESMRRRFSNDPEVMAVLQEVFSMLRSNFFMGGGAGGEAPSESAPASGSQLWTPDSESS